MEETIQWDDRVPVTPIQACLVGLEERFKVIFQDDLLCLQVIHIMRRSLGRDDIVQSVNLAEIELDQPCRQKHALYDFLRGSHLESIFHRQ